MASGSRIEADTRALALPHGRRVSQPGHDEARRYLARRLAEIGLAPFAGDAFELPFEEPHPVSGQMTPFVNLVGTARGTRSSRAPILVGAHYDSVIDGPCVDDNATAVAVCLAVAERLVTTPQERDVIVALFDSEEQPFAHTNAMGSVRFYEDHCRGVELACAVIMDLVGHDVEVGHPQLDAAVPHLRELLFVMGAESHPALPGVVEAAAGRVDGLRVFPALHEYVGDMSDHFAFRRGGTPFLFLSCGRGRHYHQPEDDMRWVNLDKVDRVFRFVAELVVAADAASLAGGARPHDPAAFEVRMIERAIGEPLPALLGALGIESLRTRADLDRLAKSVEKALVV